MAISLTIRVQFEGQNETKISEDTFILSLVSFSEIDKDFIDEFVEASIGEGTACQFLENVLPEEFRTNSSKMSYPNNLFATHALLTGSVLDWKILNYEYKAV